MSVLLKVQGYAAQSKSKCRPNAASVAELRKFSFLNNDGLVNELPRYLAAADGTVIEEEEEKVQLWARHARTLPNWSAVVHTYIHTYINFIYPRILV